MFIDIKEGLSIEIKHIEAVEEIDQLNCLVYTTRHSYTVNMPKSVVISMITSRNKNSSEGNVERLLTQLYTNNGAATPRP